MTYGVLAGCIASQITTPIVLPSRFWVGGTNSWNATATGKWSTTSGGASGAATPTIADGVAIDANSGAGTITIITATALCKGLNCTGFTGTLAGSTAMTCAGSYTLNSVMTYSYTGSITLSSTAAGNTITTAGKTISNLITINGVGGGWTLQDDFSYTSSLSVINGALNTNGKTVTVSGISASTGTFNLTLGSSVVTLNSLTMNTVGLTISAASSTINHTSATASFDSVSATYGTLNLTGGFGATGPSIRNTIADGALTFGTLTRSTAAYGNLFISTPIVVNTSFVMAGANSNTQRLSLISFLGSTPLAPISVVLNGSTTVSNADFSGITVTGSAAPITGASLGDFGGNSGITFTAPVTRYLVTAAGNNDFMGAIWATSTGGVGSASAPLAQDTLVIDGNSFPTTGCTLSLSTYRVMSLDFTNATNSPTLDAGTSNLYGSLTLIAGMSITGTGTLNLVGRGTQVITSAGRTFTCSLQIKALGTVSLADDFITTAASNAFFYLSGTFNDNNHNVTATSLLLNVVGSQTWNKGSGIYTITGTGTVVNFISVATLTFTDAGTIKLTNNSSSTKTFAGAGKAFNIVWNATAGTGTVTITGSNTISELKSDASRTIFFTANTTQTVTTLTLGASCVLQSSSGTLQATIANASGVAFAATGTTVTRMNVTGAGLVVTGGVDGGGNTGVTFI